MKNYIKCFAIPALFIFYQNNICSQNTEPKYYLPTFTPATPSAASLAKSISYPVNHGTGLVDIKIPLYDVFLGDIKVPIYLTYHASGIKVQSPFSWVGAGWSLVAEPAVSRIVDGLPDEKSYYFAQFVSPYQSNLASYLFDWLNDNSVDQMPDKFFYRLTDKSGGFNFRNSSDNTHDIVVHPFEPLKIQETTRGNVRIEGFVGFTITDEKGLIYTFGDNCIERTTTETYGPLGPLDNSCWKGKSIESIKTNSLVNFEYYSPNSITEYFPKDYVGIEEHMEEESPCAYEYITIPGKDGTYLKTAKIYDSYNGVNKLITTNGYTSDLPADNDRFSVNRFTELQLQTIRFGNYTIKFIRKHVRDGYYLLERIQVIENETKILRQINFKMSRLGMAIDNPPIKNEILYKLDSLEISGSNTIIEEKYKFNYYTPERFPSRYSRSIDYWGYYNGRNNDGKSLVPLQGGIFIDLTSNSKKEFSIGASNREPNNSLEFITTGVLKDIIYPTGGKTGFIYEQNNYWYSFEEMYEGEKNGGGLRIGKITEDPGGLNSLKTIKTYDYSKGICKKPLIRYHDEDKYPLPDYFSQKMVTYFYIGQIVCENSKKARRTYFSDPMADINTSNGSFVVYPSVTEYLNNEIKTIYYYNHFLENTPIANINVDHRNDWNKGQVDSIVEYKKATDQTYKIVRKRKYIYETYNNTETPAYKNKSNVHFVGYTYDLIPNIEEDLSFDFYDNTIYSGCVRLSEENEILFDDNQHKVSSKIHYDYRNPGESDNISRLCYPRVTEKEIEKKINNNDSLISEIVREENFYPQDIILSGSADVARRRLIDYFAIGTLLEKNVTRGKISGDFLVDYGGRPVSSTRYDYNIFENSSFPQLSTISTGKDANSREMRIQLFI